MMSDETPDDEKVKLKLMSGGKVVEEIASNLL